VRLRQIAVALDIRDLQFEILFELYQAPQLGAEVSIDLVTQMLRAVFQRLAQPPINLVHLLGDRRAVRLQAQRVLLDEGQRVLQPVETPAHLRKRKPSLVKIDISLRHKPAASQPSIMQLQAIAGERESDCSIIDRYYRCRLDADSR